MIARFYGKHNFIIGQHGADGQYTAAQGFTQDQNVGVNTFVIAGQ